MLIGGGRLIQRELRPGERLLRQSRHDVEEISRYGEEVCSLYLFSRASKFDFGRLFLTDQRLILLPYCQEEVDKAHRLQDVSYGLLDKAGLAIPKPRIDFSDKPLLIELDQIHMLNPFQRQFGIHPTLLLLTSERTTYRLKFVPGESPQQWARAIADLSSPPKPGTLATVTRRTCTVASLSTAFFAIHLRPAPAAPGPP